MLCAQTVGLAAGVPCAGFSTTNNPRVTLSHAANLTQFQLFRLVHHHVALAPSVNVDRADLPSVHPDVEDASPKVCQEPPGVRVVLPLPAIPLVALHANPQAIPAACSADWAALTRGHQWATHSATSS